MFVTCLKLLLYQSFYAIIQNTHMFGTDLFLNDSLHFILTYTITANTMTITIITPTRDTVIMVVLVIVLVIIVVVIVEEPHSSSVKEIINTGQEDSTFKIFPVILIEGLVDTHCCNICTRSSAAISDVP